MIFVDNFSKLFLLHDTRRSWDQPSPPCPPSMGPWEVNLRIARLSRHPQGLCLALVRIDCQRDEYGEYHQYA